MNANSTSSYHIEDVTTIVGIQRGKTVFFGLDRYSGGCPFWAHCYHNAERFDSVATAVKVYNDVVSGKSLLPIGDVTDIRIVTVHSVFNIVDTVEQQRAIKEQALSKLTDAEKQALGLV